MSRCRSCQTVFAEVDDWCAFCGAPLANFSLTPTRAVLRGDTREVELVVENHGVKAGAFALRSADVRAFPEWLSARGVVVDRARALAPGERASLTLEVDPDRLPSGARRKDHERSSGHHKVPLVTASLHWQGARSDRASLHVELAAQSRPRVSPEVIAYRFLPLEEVLGGELEAHEVSVVNEGGHEIELNRTSVDDAPLGELEGLVHLPAAAIVVVPPLVRAHTLGPDEVYAQKIGLRLDEGLDHPAVHAVLRGALGVFAADVSFGFDGSDAEANVRVEGIVGFGPRLRLEGEQSNIVRASSGPTRGSLMVKNPGAVSVNVSKTEVLLPNGEPAPEDDWLKLEGVNQRQTSVAPQGQREISFWVDPARRPKDELDEPWGERILRVRHDGIAGETGQRLETKISAELGRVRTLRTAVIGVDFGTSNSSVCLLHGESGHAASLVLDPEAGEEQLASLMFYRGKLGPSQTPFLFGKAAENAASINFANLVRSIKSVVARDPETVFNFVETGQKGARQLATYRSQDLLEIFIGELKRRAESGVRRLPADLLGALGLLDTGVRFERAVFTHPVGVASDVVAALFRAAQAAGLAPAQATEADQERFFEDDTLDEALAAVVAFTYVVASKSDEEFAVGDTERVLCIDVGGGTTDMAAVEVKGIASFRAGTAERVELLLLASGGDARFGGDDLDRLLAEHLLSAIERDPEGQSLDVAGVRSATGYPSFESFRRAVLERYEGTTADGGALAERARQLFGTATDLLRAAERAKVALTKEAAVNLIAPTSEWPRRGQTAQQRALRLEVELTRGEAQRLYAPKFAACAELAVPVTTDAGWSFDDITCVLFTGQGSRVPELQEAILAKIQSGRTTPLPKVIAPGGLKGFDEKRCVAMGAAVWGDSKSGGGGWLSIKNRGDDALSTALQTRRGPRFVDVEGLQAGASLPARGTHRFAEPARALTLYRGRKLAYRFEFSRPMREVAIVAHSDHEVVVMIGDEEIRGESAP